MSLNLLLGLATLAAVCVLVRTIHECRSGGVSWGTSVVMGSLTSALGFAAAMTVLLVAAGVLILTKEAHMRLTTEREVLRVPVPALAEHGLQQMHEEGRHQDMPRYLARWFPYPWFSQNDVRTILRKVDGKTFVEVQYYPNQKEQVEHLMEKVRP